MSILSFSKLQIRQNHKIPTSAWQKSNLDKFYRKFIPNNPFYNKGIAPSVQFAKSSIWMFDNYFTQEKSCSELVAPLIKDYNINLTGVKTTTFKKPITSRKNQIIKGYMQVRANYKSPICDILQCKKETIPMVDYIDEKLKTGHFELVLPIFENPEETPPIVIQFAGTGDHGYKKRRENITLPILRDYGIGSLIYENAFYGQRKPNYQIRSALTYLSDLTLIGACVAFEMPIICKFLDNVGLNKIAFSGISLGGHLACFATTCSDRENTPCIPVMSWTDSSVVWTEGLMNDTIGFAGIESNLNKNPEFIKLATDIKSKNLPNLPNYIKGIDWKTPKDSHLLSKSVTTNSIETIRILSSKFSSLKSLTKLKNQFLVNFIVMKNDAYYPQIDNIESAQDIWPHCKVWSFDNMGHVEGYIRQNVIFGPIVNQIFEKMKFKETKCYDKILENFDQIGYGSDDDWIDNRTKSLAIFDPLVVLVIKSIRGIFCLKDVYYNRKDSITEFSTNTTEKSINK